MKYLSVFVTLFLIALANAAGTFAYFQLDEKFTGKPTRTVLPDGRIHLKIEERNNQPFPEGVKLPTIVTKDGVHSDSSVGAAISDEPKDHFYSVKGEAIMKAHWEIFQLEDHTDADKTVCHDRGDKNMRMSIFGASAKLTDYLKNKKESIILQADASQHVCHNEPIFRIVTEVHFFGNEALIITAKASYEDLFDEADLSFDIKHPSLTHISNEHDFIYEGADHGVVPNGGSELHIADTTAPQSTFGSNAVAASLDRMNPQDNSALQTSSSAASSRNQAVAQGWFKKLKKKVKKAVKKVVSKVKKAVSKVTKAVSKGISAVKSKIAQWTSYEYKKQSSLLRTKKNYARSLKGVKFTLDFYFASTFKFHLNIVKAKLQVFHASVRGSLNFGAAAQLPKKRYTDSAQSLLWNLPVSKFNFKIFGISLYIQYSTKCIAAYTMNAGAEATVGFRGSGYAIFGVEYTPGRGFQQLFNKNLRHTETLKYSASFDAAPEVAAQANFKLYSLATGYAQLNMGLDVAATTTNKYCTLIKINANFYFQMSGGLDLEIKIDTKLIKKTIYSKSWGPKTIATYKYPVLNVCKKKSSSKLQQLATALTATAESVHLAELEANHHALPQYQADGTPVLRDALTLSSDPITELDEDDSGKVWSTDFTCPGDSTTTNAVTVTGFFQNDTTVVYITMTRNTTVTPAVNTTTSYTLSTQSALGSMESAVVAGANNQFKIMAANAANAEALGLDAEDLQDLEQSSGDNETSPLALTYMNITWGQVSTSAPNMQDISVYVSQLCSSPASATSLPNNSTEPAAPADGSYFGRLFADFAASLFPAFIRLITDVLVTVLILAIIEFVLAHFAPRFISPEHWPKTATTPRTREYTYAVVGVCVGILSMIIFVVGANITFAEITGAQLAPNFTAPVADQGESSYLTASGVQTIVWKFNGASIELNKCPQYYPCSPDCRDLCAKQDRTWTNAPWPYCPSDTTVETDNGGCTKFAWDNILNAIFFVLFITVGPVLAIKKCDTIYRRLPVLHGCLMLAGMFLNLIWRRMDSFMTEVEVQMFDPANEMIIPFDLAMNADSEGTWKTACTLYWIMVGAVAVGSAYDIYLFRKDTLEGRMVKFDDTFEADGAGADYKKAVSPSPTGNARARGDTEFTRDVAADLAGLGEAEVEPTKQVNDNELSLM